MTSARFQFNALTTSQRTRLVAACSGRGDVPKLAFTAGASSCLTGDERLKMAVSVGGFLLLTLGALALGFGDADSEYLIYGGIGLAVIAAPLTSIAWLLSKSARRWADSIMSAAPEGAYLFPLDVVVINGATVTAYSIPSLVRVARVERRFQGFLVSTALTLHFPTASHTFALPYAQALLVQRQLVEFDARFGYAAASGDFGTLAQMDVLFEARATPAWSALLAAADGAPVRAVDAPGVTWITPPPWLRARWVPALAVVCGVLAGVTAWATRNALSDYVAFEATVRGQTPAHCRRYRNAGGSRPCVEDPAAETGASPPRSIP